VEVTVEHGPERGRAQPLAEASAAKFDLLEREGELAMIEGAIDASERGGRLLVIEGPPGIGKTSLVAEAKARAQRAGMQVLSARGSELLPHDLCSRQEAGGRAIGIPVEVRARAGSDSMRLRRIPTREITNANRR
jgi:hypothetical protein